MAGLSSFHSTVDRVNQRLHAVRHILDPAVYEECWCVPYTTFLPVAQMLANNGQVDVLLDLLLERRNIEAKQPRVLAQIVALQVGLILEQQIVHLPEFALGIGRFRGFGCLHCMWVVRFDGKMAIDKSYLLAEAREQQFDRGSRLLASRALEIAVFDDGHRGIGRA